MRAYRKSRSEIDELAAQIVRREVHIATPGPMLDNSFGMLLALVNPPPTQRQLDTIGAVYEERSKASPRMLNGQLIFWSCQFVHVKDMKRLRKAVERKEAALNGRRLLNRLFSSRITASGSVS